MYHFPKKSIVGRAAVASIGWAKASFRSYVEMVDLTSENDFDAISAWSPALFFVIASTEEPY